MLMGRSPTLMNIKLEFMVETMDSYIWLSNASQQSLSPYWLMVEMMDSFILNMGRAALYPPIFSSYYMWYYWNRVGTPNTFRHQDCEAHAQITSRLMLIDDLFLFGQTIIREEETLKHALGHYNSSRNSLPYASTSNKWPWRRTTWLSLFFTTEWEPRLSNHC